MTSSYEKKFAGVLRKYNIKFYPEHAIKLPNKTYRVDFFIKPNICVEIDGEIFHNYPYGTETDSRKTTLLSVNGYRVFRFWGRQILDNPDGCALQIKNALNTPRFILPSFRLY